jgi:hypothetical protein
MDREMPSGAELERAARLLEVRSRREVSSAFAGGYRSAFRGGGIEFEESRPYLPGDDVRALDWNATARSGVPYVKRFREERDQTVMLAVDVSASMASDRGPAKAASLPTRISPPQRGGPAIRGPATFADALRVEVEPGGSPGSSPAAASAGPPPHRRAGDLAVRGLDARLRAGRGGRAVGLATTLRSAYRRGAGAEAASPAWLVRLARRRRGGGGDRGDPRSDLPPPALRIRRGRGGVLLLRSDRRERYQRRRAPPRPRAGLRSDSADVLWLRTDRDPLRAWPFFEAPGSRGSGGGVRRAGALGSRRSAGGRLRRRGRPPSGALSIAAAW